MRTAPGALFCLPSTSLINTWAAPHTAIPNGVRPSARSNSFPAVFHTDSPAVFHTNSPAAEFRSEFSKSSGDGAV